MKFLVRRTDGSVRWLTRAGLEFSWTDNREMALVFDSSEAANVAARTIWDGGYCLETWEKATVSDGAFARPPWRRVPGGR